MKQSVCALCNQPMAATSMRQWYCKNCKYIVRHYKTLRASRRRRNLTTMSLLEYCKYLVSVGRHVDKVKPIINRLEVDAAKDATFLMSVQPVCQTCTNFVASAKVSTKKAKRTFGITECTSVSE